MFLRSVRTMDGLNYHIRRIISCQKIQECRFSCTVTADYSDLLISLEVVCEGIKITFVAVVETEVLAVDYLGTKTCRSLHGLHADLLLGIDLRSSVLEVVECVYAVSGLSCTGTWSAAYPFQFTT